ncbi:MAG: hypothetical protein JNK09_07370 [Prolixibacteraceae bacterium]|nr:hypothetical protein [Prolixibacteraceae bacterium]
MQKTKLTLLLILFWSIVAHGQSRWAFELHGGEVYNVPMPLKIIQKGFPELKLTARYNTEALTLPVYWDLRLSKWKNNKSVELEAIHHKLYLDNTTEEVEKFNISHGFNMLFVNRGFEKKTLRYRCGIGLVIIHPESRIRGREFGDSTDDWDMGYYLTGPALNLSSGKAIAISKRFYLNVEGKTTFAYSKTKIAEGKADVYNLAFHLIIGFGTNFVR